MGCFRKAGPDAEIPTDIHTAAATTLLKLLIESGTPASVRAGVADSIFNHAAKAIEIEDIEARVAALEAAAKGQQRG